MQYNIITIISWAKMTLHLKSVTQIKMGQQLPCVQEVIYIVTHYINWGNYFLDTAIQTRIFFEF